MALITLQFPAEFGGSTFLVRSGRAYLADSDAKVEVERLSPDWQDLRSLHPDTIELKEAS
jgi:hypothetical protein